MADKPKPGGKAKKDARTAFVPKAQIELGDEGGFRIVLDKTRLADLFDQGADMMKPGQGCISAPGGPSC